MSISSDNEAKLRVSPAMSSLGKKLTLAVDLLDVFPDKYKNSRESNRRHSISPLLQVSGKKSPPKFQLQKASRLPRFSLIPEIIYDEEPEPPPEPKEAHVEIAKQGEQLCYRYLYTSLRSSKYLSRYTNLSRLKGTFFSSTSTEIKEVSVTINSIGAMFEKNNEKLFDSLLMNLSTNIPQHLISRSYLLKVYTKVAKQIFYSADSTQLNITWSKIVVTFALAAALSRDCYRIGHPDYTISIVKSFYEFILKDLSSWIDDQGGWASMIDHFIKPVKNRDDAEWIFLIFIYLMIIISISITILYIKGLIF